MQTDSRTHNRVSSSTGRKNTLSSAMAIASAVGLIPLASESAIAFPEVASSQPLPLPQQVPSRVAQSAAALDQAQAIAPQVTQLQQATFSQKSSLAPSTLATSSHQPTATSEDENGNWRLLYATQANTPQANATVQNVIAQIVAESARAQTCRNSACRQLAYIDSQISSTAEKIQHLEKQIDNLSAQYGQGDISAYQTILGDRLLEVSSQQQQLVIELDQTRLRAEQTKTQLSFANVTADIAEQILSKNDDYQALWNQLEAVEADIQKEYAQVNIDGTALNQLYSDYQDLLKRTQTGAQTALSRHLAAKLSAVSNQISSIGDRAPLQTQALETLVFETHQQNVQQLRSEKLAVIEAELIDQQRRLSERIGEYESLQRELSSERRMIDNYHSERNRILAESSALESANPTASASPKYVSQSLLNARALLPMLPSGSVAKTLLGIAIAASLVATVAHRSSEKKAAVLGKRILEIIPASSRTAISPVTQTQKVSLADIEETQTKTQIAQVTKVTQFIDLSKPLPAQEVKPTKQSFCVVNDLGEFEISESAALSLDEVLAEIEADRLSADIKAATFDEALKNLTTESLFLESDNHSVAPVKLPVEEIDLFVEKAVEWVLEDLGLAIPGANAAVEDAHLLAVA